jgi:hypothetical protein
MKKQRLPRRKAKRSQRPSREKPRGAKSRDREREIEKRPQYQWGDDLPGEAERQRETLRLRNLRRRALTAGAPAAGVRAVTRR